MEALAGAGLQILPVSKELAAMAKAAEHIYAEGDVLAERDALAMNFLLDRSAELRNRELADLHQKYGACRTEPIEPDTAMGATITWNCEHGALKVNLLLAPTSPPTLQRLEITP